jgi:hypothetical protein
MSSSGAHLACSSYLKQPPTARTLAIIPRFLYTCGRLGRSISLLLKVGDLRGRDNSLSLLRQNIPLHVGARSDLQEWMAGQPTMSFRVLLHMSANKHGRSVGKVPSMLTFRSSAMYTDLHRISRRYSSKKPLELLPRIVCCSHVGRRTSKERRSSPFPLRTIAP